ncbi:MAG: hypothetical protein WKG00_24805 [Polyangiaceae bacterium]
MKWKHCPLVENCREVIRSGAPEPTTNQPPTGYCAFRSAQSRASRSLVGSKHGGFCSTP